MRVRRLVWLSCLLASCLSPGAARSAGLPSAAEILKSLKSQKQAVENVAVKATWEEVWGGKLTSWEDQTFSWDSLGRRRVVYTYGTFDSQGRRVRPPDASAETDTLYDGEIVVLRESYPNRDRLGRMDEPGKGKAAAKPDGGAKGYRTAIITDALAPSRKDVEGHRNPMEYLRNIAIRDLEEAVVKGRKTTVEAGQAPNTYRVGFDLEPNPELPYVRSVIDVDGDRDFVITKLESFGAKGQTVRRIEYEYRQQDGGLWVPAKGSHRHWGDRPTTAPPVYEWRFTASKFRVNDPSFDEGVFRLALTPDTAVSDARYGVAYRIGSEKATASDLSQLAQEARTEKAAERERTEAPRNTGWRVVWGGITVALVAGVFVYMALARKPGA